MTGQIIHFMAFCSRKDGPAMEKQRGLKLQVARIRRLLDEVELLARTSEGTSQSVLGRANVKVRARTLLQCLGPRLSGQGEHESDGDPQPDVDPEVLERMYRRLDPDTAA